MKRRDFLKMTGTAIGTAVLGGPSITWAATKSEEPIKIGMISPVAGVCAQWGIPMFRGARIWGDEHNAKILEEYKKNILDEASKINGLDSDLIDKLKKIKTREEILAVTWCLDNYIPLSIPKPHSWSLIFYEKLVKDGKKEIIRIFNEIGEKRIPNAAIKNLKKPSMVILKEELKLINKPDLQLSKWKGYLSEDQINKILQIVSDFGLDFYTEQLEPEYDIVNR